MDKFLINTNVLQKPRNRIDSKQISDSKHEIWNKLQGVIPLDLRSLRQLTILDLLYFSGYGGKIRGSKGYPQSIKATQDKDLKS